jgi:RNA polymerase sigma-70 factor (ECF subfamily)
MQNKSTDSETLIKRLREGDPKAFERIFAQHRPYLRQVVELRLGGQIRRRVDPSDIVQEAQIEALRRLPAYLDRPSMPLRLWLRQITYDRLIMAHRRHVAAQRRSTDREVALPDQSTMQLANQLLADGDSPSRQLVKDELSHRVRQAVSELDEPDLEMLLMRNFEGLTNLEVARLLQIDPASASRRYGRSLLRLKTILADDDLTESQL